MIIKYLLQFVGSTIARYVLGSLAAAALASFAYYFVSSHFTNKVALKTAVSKQKKQAQMNAYSRQLANEYIEYKRGLTSNSIDCAGDDCTLDELKNALK